MTARLLQGDCLEVMAGLEPNSVDSVVTDPPYGLGFMGKKWDALPPGIDVAKAMFRVLKPGGYILAFGGSRTYHRLACAIEDAGFEIRDQIMWVYGSGFPKSHNISKAIDKAAGAEREVIGHDASCRLASNSNLNDDNWSKIGTQGADITAPATEAAKQWDGWGTALKPAHEPIVLARKPLSEKTVAANVLKWGTGGINIDGCRVEIDLNNEDRAKSKNTVQKTSGISFKGNKKESQNTSRYNLEQGRFPANLIHDGSQEVMDLFPETKTGKVASHSIKGMWGSGADTSYNEQEQGFNSAARFFYCPKAGKKERGEGNTHPTVKPIALMRYLCRLVTPLGGVVLDPFAGSGTTMLAATAEGFASIGIELEKEYIEVCLLRNTGLGIG